MKFGFSSSFFVVVVFCMFIYLIIFSHVGIKITIEKILLAQAIEEIGYSKSFEYLSPTLCFSFTRHLKVLTL